MHIPVNRIPRVRVHTRWMIRRDLPEVLALERDGFAEPWPEATFVRLLCRRDTIGLVAERDQQVLGHLVYRLHRDRFEVLRLAVAPGWRRQGVATQLLVRLTGRLVGERRRVVASVPERNLAAQLTLRACGFRWVATVRGLYGERYVMEYRKEGCADAQ